MGQVENKQQKDIFKYKHVKNDIKYKWSKYL